MKTPFLIDWQLVALKLRRYKSYHTIAKQVGTSAEHLRKISRGEVKSPSFEKGVALLDLAFDLLPAEEFNRLRLNHQPNTTTTSAARATPAGGVFNTRNRHASLQTPQCATRMAGPGRLAHETSY